MMMQVFLLQHLLMRCGDLCENVFSMVCNSIKSIIKNVATNALRVIHAFRLSAM